MTTTKTTLATRKSTASTKKPRTTTKSTTEATPPAEVKQGPGYGYQFPCVRGIQSGIEFYTTMIPIKLLKKLFVLDSEEMPAEMRAQRKLNPTRARKLKDYVLTSEHYTLSGVTVTIDVKRDQEDQFKFEALQADIGTLNVPIDSQFLIADGQHRIEGLKLAIADNPALQDETLPCVIFLHVGLKRAQTMFHDLNFYASKPNKSLNLLYDHHSDDSDLARLVMKGVPIFAQYTETEQTTLSTKSSKVFTFNAIDEANRYLFSNAQLKQSEKVEAAIAFWQAVTAEIPEWERLLSKEYSPGEVRQHYLCGHAIALAGIAHLGFYAPKAESWPTMLHRVSLRSVDWSKNNPEFENKIVFGGRIHKNRTTVTALGEWLYRRSMLTPEVAEAKILDWMAEHFKGWTTSDIVAALAAEPNQNPITDECNIALNLHCDRPAFLIGWSGAAHAFRQSRTALKTSLV